MGTYPPQWRLTPVKRVTGPQRKQRPSFQPARLEVSSRPARLCIIRRTSAMSGAAQGLRHSPRAERVPRRGLTIVFCRSYTEAPTPKSLVCHWSGVVLLLPSALTIPQRRLLRTGATAACLLLVGLAIPARSTQAACGDWLDHAETASRAPESSDGSGSIPCRGLACRRAPAAPVPAPSAPESIQPRDDRVACELAHSREASDLRESGWPPVDDRPLVGYRSAIEHPPRCASRD
jgi:hypothetical protein